jgi:hypothetical protein
VRSGLLALVVGVILAVCAGSTAHAAAEPVRVEAKSKSYVAVGLVEADRMTIHLSRALDNAPVHDAAIQVTIRALSMTAVAQADGSYEVKSAELKATGPAVVAFLVTRGGETEKLVGTLEAPVVAKKVTESGQARQMLWWVLNFAVCIGFLMLYSRRRKAAEARGDD